VRHHLADVVIGVRRATDDDELHPAGLLGADPAERLKQHVRVVLRLEAADEQDVALRLETEALERLGSVVARVIDAVGHDADLLARSGSKMSATACESVIARRPTAARLRSAKRRYDLASVGHLRRSESSPSTLITAGIAAQRVIRHSGELPAMKNSATSGLVTRAACSRRQEGVHEGVEVLVLDRAQVDEPRALVGGQLPVDDVRAAVDDHLVAALGQPRGELLDRRLEAAVGGGDPAGAEDRDLHLWPNVCISLARE
jgi:hypothetical protein